MKMTTSEKSPATASFEFFDTGPLTDAELTLELAERLPEDLFHDRVPSYKFHMIHREKRIRMGNISLRIGRTPLLVKNAGQIGYGVDPAYRGNRYAARSCRLLFPLARKHGLSPLWITCDPDNIASRRSCEIAGAKYVDTIRHRSSNPKHPTGYFEKCRYQIDL